MLWGLVIVGLFLMLSLACPLSPSCSSSHPKSHLSSGGLTLKVRWARLGYRCLERGNQWPEGGALLGLTALLYESRGAASSLALSEHLPCLGTQCCQR